MVVVPGILDKTIEQLQFQTRRLSDFLQRDNFLRRRLIDDIDVGTTAVAVRHGLKYQPEGYLVIRRSAGETVYDTAITNEQITLVATGSATISIIVW